MEHGYIYLSDCTDSNRANCKRQADGSSNIINPIRSARLDTKQSFSFKYGRMEVIAKMPAGDWLRPAVWLMPTHSQYGEWPQSGEIDLINCRGNRNYINENGVEIGVEQVVSTLHFGTQWNQQSFEFPINNPMGYNNDFHKFELIWNENGIKFFVDEIETGFVSAGDGFCQLGGFKGENIWKLGDKMAPFDQEVNI